MYLHLGQSVVVSHKEILGIFDLDNASWAYRTREFLERAELEGRSQWLGGDLPLSIVLVGKPGDDKPTVYLSQFSSATLAKRIENNSFE